MLRDHHRSDAREREANAAKSSREGEHVVGTMGVELRFLGPTRKVAVPPRVLPTSERIHILDGSLVVPFTWDLEPLPTFSIPVPRVAEAAVSADGNLWAFAGEERLVFRDPLGATVATIETKGYCTSRLRFSSDGAWLVLSDADQAWSGIGSTSIQGVN